MLEWLCAVMLIRIEQRMQKGWPVARSSFGNGISSGGSSSHNRYSAHLPHSRPESLDSIEWGPCHRPSKSLTLSSCSLSFGSASSDIHKNPNVKRQRQHRSRSSNVFPSKACASSGRRSLATYPFAASLSTSSFRFSLNKFTTSSTSEITHLQAWTPFSPNLAALVDSTHRWRKLSGTQTSFEVATEMLSSSGSSPATQNAIVLGAPLWAIVGPKSLYSNFS